MTDEAKARDVPDRLLVRIGGGAPPAGLSVAGAALRLQPLFPPATGRGKRSLAAGQAQAPQWSIAELASRGLAADELWDAAHELARHSALAGTAGLIVEPDLWQQWPYENARPVNPTGLGAAPGEACEFHDQMTAFPRGPGFAWHLSEAFSQLQQARDAAPVPGTDKDRVRIGVLDTGFDATHQSFPQHFDRALSRNFVDDGRDPGDFTDPFVDGFLKNPGHGTGVLGILAGNRVTMPGRGTPLELGGAPAARIIGCRIATSVVMFRTSAFARALQYLLAPGGNPALRADVVSMSMGGLPSSLWAEMVNRAYEAGIVLVTAAGNHYPGTPSQMVWPARFGRVMAACGVMADGRPYTRGNVPLGRMAGNCGPLSRMLGATLSAFSPNMPWAEIGCAAVVDMDGQGTSAATPQIAAAAALWIQTHRAALAGLAGWQRVEVVRKALLDSARPAGELASLLGRGIVQARAALDRAPDLRVVQTPPDEVSLGVFDRLFGAAPASHTDRLLALELAQAVAGDPRLQERLAEAPGKPAAGADESKARGYQRRLIDRLVSKVRISGALRERLKQAYPRGPGGDRAPGAGAAMRPLQPLLPRYPAPSRRRLRGFAVDPHLSTRHDTARFNLHTYSVPWEPLRPGPIGEYLEVIDIDPASGGLYAPADLQDPNLLAQDGLAPQEASPQFHQQMVYAVAMTTIEHFERALGRKILWSPRMRGPVDDTYVPRLRIHPHALREQNAYYDPTRKALLFGYFTASSDLPDQIYPGGTIFTCLSHDIVAHETTHAILDGQHRALLEPTNEDVLAFHEAFADVVALLQHFTMPALLAHQIGQARGDLRGETLLGQMAVEFGLAGGRRGALRNAIGRIDAATGQWQALAADPHALDRVHEPHDRGAILVAAVFDAFLTIYGYRTEDLLRIASGGTGVLPDGALHPDLVGRLAQEAARSARHLLRMCIRALDYCPPVDLDFGDYLRALITADLQLMPEDRYRYRVAVVEAFRRRGIYPQGLQSLSVDMLEWNHPDDLLQEILAEALKAPLTDFLKALTTLAPGADNRRQTFGQLRAHREQMALRLRDRFAELSSSDRDLITAETGLALDAGHGAFEVRTMQLTEKVGDRDNVQPRVLLSIVQEMRSRLEPENGASGDFFFRGGCTLIVDPITGRADYAIRKRIGSDARLAKERGFRMGLRDSLSGLYLNATSGTDPARALALLHSLEPEG